MATGKGPNRYTRLLEAIFARHYRECAREITFERAEIGDVAAELDIALPKNLGDLLYSFRYRAMLPESITQTAEPGYSWVIRPAGRGRYQFVLARQPIIVPSPLLVETKLLDATPGMIVRYALNDEQPPLAKMRYNRIIDIFTGLTCYSLQNHLRTTLPDGSQVETDEIYIGLDKRGAHYVIPVQAKGSRERIGAVQIEQDLTMCAAKFPGLVCRPIAAQAIEENLLALFELEPTDEGLKVSSEKHYRLVGASELTAEELETYRRRLE
jgi:hypothetical protein